MSPSGRPKLTATHWIGLSGAPMQSVSSTLSTVTSMRSTPLPTSTGGTSESSLGHSTPIPTAVRITRAPPAAARRRPTVSSGKSNHESE